MTTTINSISQKPLSIQTARHYHTLGFNVLPTDSDKKPLVKWASDPNWKITRQTPNDVSAMPWSKARGIAAVCGTVSGGLVVVDFDQQPDRDAVNTFLAALGLPGDYPWLVLTPGRGWHVWLISPHFPLSGAGKLDLPGKAGGHIELRYEGVLTTLPPSAHPNGGRYAFANSDPDGPPATTDPGRLITAYEQITNAPPAAPENRPKAESPRESDLPTDPNEKRELERRVRAAIAQRLVKRGSGAGYYQCPLEHGPAGKDFLFSPDPDQPIGGCQGKHAGQLTRWVDLAIHLEIDVSQIASVLAQARRFGRPARTTDIQKVRHFPYGLPYTLSKRLRNVHLKAAVKSQHPADLVWVVWQELDGVLPADRPFTAGEFQAAAALIRRNPSRDTVETGLDQLVAWGTAEICDNCDLAIQNDPIDRLQKSQISKRRTRPGKQYRFLPIDQQIAHFERHYAYLLREHAFAGVPSDVQPEYGELVADEIATLDETRRPVYLAYADQREAAQAQLDRGVGLLEGAIERIRQGRYRPVVLPPGEIPNTRVYRRLIQKLQVPADGTVREKAYRDMFEVGCSASTLARLRAANGVITVPREERIPVDTVTDYQRERGLVLAEHEDGTITVRRPAAEKFADLADESERRAFEDLRQRQRENRARVGDQVSQFEAEPHHKPTTIPPAYSDRHLLEQYDFTPGAESIPRFDLETGGVYTPGQLWRALAEQLKATPESQAGRWPLAASVAPVGSLPENVVRAGRSLCQDGPIEPRPVVPCGSDAGQNPLAPGLCDLAHGSDSAGNIDLPSHPEAYAHECECCARPAAMLHFTGWYCREHIRLPLADMLRLGQEKGARQGPAP